MEQQGAHRHDHRPKQNETTESVEAMSKNKSIFEELLSVDVARFVEKKGKFSYLSWSYAVSELRQRAPDATWTVCKFPLPDQDPVILAPYCITPAGCFVEVAVTVAGVTLSQVHPVIDERNQTIKLPNAYEINKSIMRCLVKAIALHGLGLNIYAGEDLPMLEETPINAAQKAKMKALCKEHSIGGNAFAVIVGEAPTTFDAAEIAIDKLITAGEAKSKAADPSKSTTSGSAIVDVYVSTPKGMAASQSTTDRTVSGLAGKDDGKPARTTATTTTLPKESSSNGGSPETTTTLLLAFKKAVDRCKSAPAVGLTLADWAERLSLLPARPRLIADGYASGHLKTLAGELQTAEEQRIATILNDLNKE
jgi:hypothetical protein